MNFKILISLFLVVCIAVITHAQVPALTSLHSKYTSFVEHSQTRYASSASSAISRISSEINRSSSESVASSSSAAQQSGSSSVAANPTSTDAGAAGGQTNTANNNGNGEQTGDGGQATAAAGGTSAGMSIFSGLTNVIIVQIVAWSTLFVVSFVAMFM